MKNDGRKKQGRDEADNEDDYAFDQDIDELQCFDNPIELNCRKIDNDRARKMKMRELILGY